MSIFLNTLKGSFIFLRANEVLCHMNIDLAVLAAGGKFDDISMDFVQAIEIIRSLWSSSLKKAKHRMMTTLIYLKLSFTKLVAVWRDFFL